MNLLWYLFTRAFMALGALMCVDVIADTTRAAEPTSILAMMGLLVIVEVLIHVNAEEASGLTANDIIEARQKAQIRHLTQDLEDSHDGR